MAPSSGGSQPDRENSMMQEVEVCKATKETRLGRVWFMRYTEYYCWSGMSDQWYWGNCNKIERESGRDAPASSES